MDSGLLKFCNNKFLSDVTIKVEDIAYKAHKVVLAAASVYYYRIFENENKNEVAFPPYVEPKFSSILPKQIFENILKFMYSDQHPEILSEFINADTANAYLACGYSLGIQSLTEISCDYIIDHLLTPENSANYLLEGIKFYSDQLIQAASTSVLTHFQELAKNPKNSEILENLPYKIILDMISSDDLKVDSEKIVYDFLCGYINTNDPQKLKFNEQETFELFSKVRWPFLSHNELLEAAGNTKIGICKDMVLEGLSVQLAEHNKPKDYVYKVIKTARKAYTVNVSPPHKTGKNFEMPIRFLSKSVNS